MKLYRRPAIVRCGTSGLSAVLEKYGTICPSIWSGREGKRRASRRQTA